MNIFIFIANIDMLGDMLATNKITYQAEKLPHAISWYISISGLIYPRDNNYWILISRWDIKYDINTPYSLFYAANNTGRYTRATPASTSNGLASPPFSPA